MEKSSAIRIVRRTFQNPFDKEPFVYFIKSLLNHIEKAPFVYRGNFIPDAYEPYIKTLERIGKYQDRDEKKIDLLIVHLKKETSLERARTMQRNFIGWYLNGSRGDVLKDAALVAFVSPDSEDWRFSLVKMDYRLDASGGKVKVQQELTPARRFSFLVGKTESSHTAQSRLVPILQDDNQDPTLKDLEEAFSIEKVTKEFFEKYRELFLKAKEALDEVIKKDKKVKQDFGTKDIDTVNFAKKLLGQVVFLYFLQKKGWFGVERDEDWGAGPKNFLRLLFKKGIAKYGNFFNEILEPLFYEALAIERTDDFYSRFNCKIPFLNGGLFDPINNYDWIHTDILLPNELFSNSTKTKEGDVGTGILDIFDRYNFTVKEDEPLEKEVAIDPEMLGKVFENLLEVKDRKSKGTYYTPREIVHYMCQQSLINYLATELKGKVKKEDIETLIKYGETVVEHDSRVVKEGKETKTYSFKLPKSVRDNTKLIDEKLASIRVCDPAVGSGAFPVGMMNEVIRTRNALTNYIKDKKKRTIYDFKRHAIQNCLYGVDIDPGAVEIAKLRLWLSLIVDEEDINQIKPLPNLDYKIIQGNSLIELLSPEFLAKTVDNKRSELIDKFNQDKKEFFEITSSSEKTKKREEINNLIKELFAHDKNLIINNLKQKIRSIQNQGRLFKDVKLEKDDKKRIEEIENKIKEFQQIRMPGPVDHFEWHLNFSEIFREKKGFDVVLANPPYVEHKKLKGISNLLKGRFKTYSGTADLYVYFYEVALNILREKGILTFISSNKFIRAKYGANLRALLTENKIYNLIDFTKVRIFDALVASCIVLVSKDKPTDSIIVTFADDNFAGDIVGFIENNYIKVPLASLGSDIWQLEDSRKLKIKERIEFGSKKLGDIKGIKIYRGITTGYNPAFIISRNVKNRLIKKDKRNTEIIKPLLQGRNIKKWFYNTSNQYLLQTGFERDIKSDFPSVYIHLSNYEKELKKRDDQGKNWWNLRACKYYADFEKEKIIWGLTADKWAFAYDNKKYYLPSNGYILTSESKLAVKYLLALLNSTLLKFYFRFIGIMTAGGAYTLKHETIKAFPVKEITKIEQQSFIDFVDKILAITKDENYLQNSAKQVKVKEYEKQIDQLVYKLYGLTPEEIKIIENKL